MPTGQKHLIKCRCVLPQFRHLPEPTRHHFIVFSVVEDDNKVRVKFEQCNNCGIIHKVIDICTSEILPGKEFMSSIVTIGDIKPSLHKSLVEILDLNQADLPTWQAAQFIYENKRWGEFVVLNTDVADGVKQGKYLTIIGESLFKVDSFTRDEFATR